jgi:replicative DNA helicase
VLEQYERTERGEIGIPFPWPTMTAMTMGLWPGTLTFFVARPGVGKTWTAVIMALFAWAAGKKVLIVSPELNRVELGERFVAKYGAYSYSDMVTAKLGLMGKAALKRTVDELVQKGDNLFILDDEEHIGPESIEQAIETVEPDIILIDSLYMLRVEQGKIKGKGPGSKNSAASRSDRIVETVDWARGLSRRVQRPIVGISQLSRDAKMKKEAADSLKRGKGTGGLEDAVALSDALFQDAHNLFALFQDRDMRLDKQLVYVPLKVRRQAMISHVCVRWDMEKMDFSEIGSFVPNSGGGGDDSRGGKSLDDGDYESAF